MQEGRVSLSARGSRVDGNDGGGGTITEAKGERRGKDVDCHNGRDMFICRRPRRNLLHYGDGRLPARFTSGNVTQRKHVPSIDHFRPAFAHRSPFVNLIPPRIEHESRVSLRDVTSRYNHVSFQFSRIHRSMETTRSLLLSSNDSIESAPTLFSR